jgi:hypothetical protein
LCSIVHLSNCIDGMYLENVRSFFVHHEAPMQGRVGMGVMVAFCSKSPVRLSRSAYIATQARSLMAAANSGALDASTTKGIPRRSQRREQ